MTRKRKKYHAPQRWDPEHSEQMASQTVVHLASGSVTRVQDLYSVLAVCGFLLLATTAVFGQTASHDFVNFDDDEYVCQNWHVRGGLTGAGAAWAVTACHASNWHPLTWLSHMLDCQFYGLKPGGHHLTNVFLHAVTAILLFLALRRMTAALWPSAWVATVFAIHPLRVESVAWVAERKDVLGGLFFMLTVWFYTRYVERPSSWGRYLLVLASFAMGLTAKPMLVTLPFVLLLLDYWPLGRGQGAGDGKATNQSPTIHARSASGCADRPPLTTLERLVVEKIPLFVVAAASCMVTYAAHRDAIRPLERLAVPRRVANAAVAYVAYLGKMLYPAGLAVLYPLPKGPPPAWEVVIAVILLVAISTAVFVARRKCTYLLFGWLWYLGTLVPVIGLVQVGGQAMADRYTYLTQIGLYTALAWGAAQVAASWRYWRRPNRRWPLAAVSALVVAGLMVCAWQQTRYWRDSETLWIHTLACTSQNPTAHTSLGVALASRGQIDEAIANYEKALQIMPDHAPAHNNLGVALASRGRFDEAIVQCQKALEIMPDHAESHYNLGVALASRGRFDEAIAHFQKALEIMPDYAEAQCNLGIALGIRGRVGEAGDHFQKALDLASARNDRALADVVRARIRLLPPAAPAGNAP
ncbi:MAG: tetratricopeptide repeat protein [Thermoguttaceae bacterium]